MKIYGVFSHLLLFLGIICISLGEKKNWVGETKTFVWVCLYRNDGYANVHLLLCPLLRGADHIRNTACEVALSAVIAGKLLDWLIFNIL